MATALMEPAEPLIVKASPLRSTELSQSVSVRLTFQAPDRTLTDAEVQQSVEAILAALVREHQAVQR